MTSQRRLLARLTVATALIAAPLTALAVPATAAADPSCAQHSTADACDSGIDYDLPNMADPSNPISPMNPTNPVNPANPLYADRA
ncbi:hypothetical protein ACFVVM_20670 [Nocardia sp. NPDC058176]|uniref:hypothetical protein n=1 Tax=Nocardia sp. NPDC058176 TaxID=3346368 RepID=UPI0036DC5BF0